MRIRRLNRPAAYEPVWQAMQSFTQQRTSATDDELWLVEHAPVYTLGQAGLDAHILDAGGIPVVRCNRGGQVTYHGPGQIILYTLVDLRRRGVFVREFVHLLEQAVIDVLVHAGVPAACRRPGAPGVYVPQSALLEPHGGALAKIAALGVKVSRGCAYHGVALNVAMDLAPFSHINPCGHAGLRTVDMRACGVDADPVAVGEALARSFSAAWESAGRPVHAL